MKKQGVLQLIDTYLNRKGIEDLLFLKLNVGYTNEIANFLGSNASKGLKSDQISINDREFGRNCRDKEMSNCWQKMSKSSKE